MKGAFLCQIYSFNIKSHLRNSEYFHLKRIKDTTNFKILGLINSIPR